MESHPSEIFSDNEFDHPIEAGTVLLDALKPGWSMLVNLDEMNQSNSETHLCSYVFGSFDNFLTGPLEHEAEGRQIFVRDEDWQNPEVWGLERSKRFQRYWKKRIQARQKRLKNIIKDHPDLVPAKILHTYLSTRGDICHDEKDYLVSIEKFEGVKYQWILQVPPWYAKHFGHRDHEEFIRNKLTIRYCYDGSDNENLTVRYSP